MKQEDTMHCTPGKFIVLYGVNNVGKTTQANLLKKRLENAGLRVETVKYALYDISPTGPLIYDYIHSKNTFNLTPREFQILQVTNRWQFDASIREKLTNGIWIIAEDYSGTGIAWGMASGVEKQFLLEINRNLHKEDIAFYLRRPRFLHARETNHTHETNDLLTEEAQKAHDELSHEYEWITIAADGSPDDVHAEIWNSLSKRFSMKDTHW